MEQARAIWPEVFMFITKSYAYGLKHIALAVVHYDVKNYHQYLHNEFGIILPDSIRLSCRRRGAEYLAGRFAAKRCLLQLGETDYHVNSEPSGKPCWPGLMTGSISHSPSIAVSVVCHSGSACCAVGIDVENIVSMQDVNDLSSLIMTKDESRFLFSEVYSQQQVFTAIFSAKEAAFKAISHFGEYSIDFDTLIIEKFDFETGQYTVFSEQSNRWVKGEVIISRGYALAVAFIYCGLDLADNVEEYFLREIEDFSYSTLEF